MHKLLKTKAAFAGLVGLAVISATASAQSTSNDQLLTAGLKEQFSAGEVSSIMTEFAVATSLAPYEGDQVATLLAQTTGGGRFAISMFECDNATVGEGCRGAVLFTAFPNAGLAYEDINRFNSEASVTKAINMADQNFIIFNTQIFFSGGIGRNNFKYLTDLFLTDMQQYVMSQATAGTSVSLEPAPGPSGGKLDNLTVAGDAAPQFPAIPAALTIEQALAAAVGNTWDVNFLPREDNTAE